MNNTPTTITDTRPDPLVTCQWEVDIPGPHPGCAEFAPDDVMTCSNAATRRVHVVDPFDDDATIDVCDEHAADVIASEHAEYGVVPTSEPFTPIVVSVKVGPKMLDELDNRLDIASYEPELPVWGIVDRPTRTVRFAIDDAQHVLDDIDVVRSIAESNLGGWDESNEASIRGMLASCNRAERAVRDAVNLASKLVTS